MHEFGQDSKQFGASDNGVAQTGLNGDLALAVLHPSGQERAHAVEKVPIPGLPGLELSKVDPCALGLKQKVQSALTDNWAVYPGTTGLVFGASSGALAKHYALSTIGDPALRQFKIARAGVIWGLAGFAANYIGGALASYYSSDDKSENCERDKEIESLRFELQRQRDQIQDLSGRMKQLFENGKR